MQFSFPEPPTAYQNPFYRSPINPKRSLSSNMSYLPLADTPVTSHPVVNHPSSDHQPRKRTRASPEQLGILEKTFNINPSPNNRVREQLSQQLGMSERSIQIWFQNRRAKVKNIAKRSSLLHDQTLRMQHYAATAAAAACQAAAYQQQQTMPDGSLATNPDLYYYYYYYYYNQQQQRQAGSIKAFSESLESGMPPPPPSSPPPPPPPLDSLPTENIDLRMWSMTPPPSITNSPGVDGLHSRRHNNLHSAAGRLRAQSVGPYPRRNDALSRVYHDRHASMGPAVPGFSMESSPSYLGMDSIDSFGYTPGSSFRQQPPIDPLVNLYSERLDTPMSCVSQEDEGIAYGFSADALQIGSWKRMMLRPQDLLCFYDPLQQAMVWRIQDGDQRFKLQVQLQAIQQIRLVPLAHRIGWARIELEVRQPERIAFYMEDPVQCTWTQCRDFTQDRQATTVHIHQLEGQTVLLRQELLRLVLDNQRLQALFVDLTTAQTSLYESSEPPIVLRSATPAEDALMMSLLQSNNDKLLYQSLDHQG
ncbi:hypothetical protein CLU79DRAFT_727077 [Phycomyces nitens]|nr:hypothetical protein CLU79DRAFT_727077 [Phycomyces nitens]